MSKIAIKAENISKQYRLGEIGTGTISHDLNRWWHKIRGKEDPFLKIGESNDRSQKGESDYVWSLKDINFEINQGDAVGIIGRNGAGKSTLLKLLSKVTKPTTGQFKVKGRIASLLEVGTGFHPEMTGRENIYLNGAILGMPRIEISRKFDEIVDFSGIERYIDTPVKRYSSGMYVRLAFAVAAHLESEILIVDEVLAVGDADFQKKCLGKMNSLSNNGGRTVLFVSHNMEAIQKLCKMCIHLDHGKLVGFGENQKIIDNYLEKESKKNSYNYLTESPIGDSFVKLRIFEILDENKKKISFGKISNLIIINIDYFIVDGSFMPEIGLAIKDYNDIIILHLTSSSNNYSVGEHNCQFIIPANLFNNGKYKISCGITTYNPIHHHLHHEIYFEYLDDFNSPTRGNYPFGFNGKIRPNLIVKNS